MNDNHWYPRDPQRFLTDTAWCDAATEVAHNRLTDTYYALGKPLVDNNEEICNIGKIKVQDYARVRGNLQRLGWKFENGELRHKRIEDTLAEMEKSRQERIARTAKARAAKSVATPVTSPVTENVTELQNEAVTGTEPQPQPQPHIEPQSQPIKSGAATLNAPVELPSGFPATLDEAKVAAQFVGCPDAVADKTWNLAMSRGGKDAKGQPITSWRHHLAAAWAFEQSRNAEKSGEKAKAEKLAGVPSLKDIRLYAGEKWGDDDRRHNWVSSFFLYWNDERRQWKKDGKVIDWKIEFTKQVAKWRQQ